MRKGDTVFYATPSHLVMKAVVQVAHRDGSAKVYALYFNREGRDTGPFIGESFEVAADHLHPNAMSAENAIASRRRVA